MPLIRPSTFRPIKRIRRLPNTLFRRLAWTCTLAVLSILSAADWADAGEQLCLNLVETETGRVAYSVSIMPGEAFTLWFLHSYDRAFFAEHYRAEGPGRICLTHMSFKSNLNGGGFEYADFHLRKDGVGELRNINELRKEVIFMMGSPDMANHTLVFRETRTPLVDYAPTGTLVALHVVKALSDKEP
jgi:hypothetical protein